MAGICRYYSNQLRKLGPICTLCFAAAISWTIAELRELKALCFEITVWHTVYQMLTSTALLTLYSHIASVKNSVKVNAVLMLSKHS